MDGQTGFLVPVGDASVMAGRVLALLEDEELRLQRGPEAAGDVAQGIWI